MKKVPDKTVTALRANVKKAYMDAFAKLDGSLTPASIRKQVSEMLLVERRNIVMALMGIDTSLGRLEAKRGTPLRNMIEEVMVEEVRKAFPKEEMEQLVQSIIDSKDVRASIKEEFTDNFMYRANNIARQLAEDVVERQGKQLIEEVLNGEE